jgi:lysozyme
VGHQCTDAGYVKWIKGKCDVDSFTEGVLLDNAAKPGGWILQNNKWQYKHNDGSYTKNGWEKINLIKKGMAYQSKISHSKLLQVFFME